MKNKDMVLLLTKWADSIESGECVYASLVEY